MWTLTIGKNVSGAFYELQRVSPIVGAGVVVYGWNSKTTLGVYFKCLGPFSYRLLKMSMHIPIFIYLPNLSSCPSLMLEYKKPIVTEMEPISPWSYIHISTYLEELHNVDFNIFLLKPKTLNLI